MAGVLYRRNVGSAGSGIAAATGLKIQSSSYGVPIPIVYGTARAPGNLIWYKDFLATAHTSPQASGGKGGPSQNTTEYAYQAAIAMGLCEGPIVGTGTQWADQDKNNLFGSTLFVGSLAQAPWAYVVTNHPAEALGYSETAYIAHEMWQLTDSASLQNYSWEVFGFFMFGGIGAILDASPKDFIEDFLTNVRYGVGVSPAKVDAMSDFSDYCAAAGLFASPVVDSHRAASDWLRDVLQTANAGLVWSGGIIKVVPYGDKALASNGATYTPDLTPKANLTDDDFKVEGSEDPIRVKRSPAADAFNHVIVEFENRDHSYNIETREAKDDASIDAYGLRPMPVVKAPWIKTAPVARLVAQLILQRSIYIRNTYEFRLSWRHCLLEPTDIVTINDTELGLDEYPVRITSIEEDELGTLAVTAEDCPIGMGNAPDYASEGGVGYDPDVNADPGDTV